MFLCSLSLGLRGVPGNMSVLVACPLVHHGHPEKSLREKVQSVGFFWSLSLGHQEKF